MATLVREFREGTQVVRRGTLKEGVVVEGPKGQDAKILWKSNEDGRTRNESALLFDVKFGPGIRVVYREDGKKEISGTVYKDVIGLCESDEVLVMFDGCTCVCRKKVSMLTLVPAAAV